MKKSLQSQVKQRQNNQTQELDNEKNDEEKEQIYLKENFPDFVLAKTFYEGEYFGEISLLTQQERTATIIARQDSHFMVLNKKGFNKETIYNEGDPSNYFFLIKSGDIVIKKKQQVPVQINDEETLNQNQLKICFKNNEQYTLKIVGQGSFFGDEELVKGIPERQERAICNSEECELYQLEQKGLYQILGYNFYDCLQQQVENKQQIKQERLEHLIKIKIPQKNIEGLNQFYEDERNKKLNQIQQEQIKQAISIKNQIMFDKNMLQNEKKKSQNVQINDTE
ncbi:hypothetical protein IMG5_091700, partial [Ichthyophthirius multifiliis]